MYELPVSLLLGYLIGCINPAWILAKHKKMELRREGTKNLGATNVYLTIGKLVGVFVLLLDIGKAFIAVILAKALFPQFAFAGVLAGAAVMLGHMFPFSLGFHGGKGSSCLAGVVIALDIKIFLVLLLLGIAISFLVNYPWALPVSAAAIFPFAYGFTTQSSMNLAILLFPCVCLILKHMENYRRVREGTEPTIHGFLKRSKHEK
ncbi:MAG: acyl-phosphate glycerol 3-phosphate acyltransferase [Clostridiales bacterium]|nr:acyl-phosphate glycerol 3-phosphate acyltransferase [Clostridiales bacterium]